jgi:hypothetical protein
MIDCSEKKGGKAAFTTRACMRARMDTYDASVPDRETRRSNPRRARPRQLQGTGPPLSSTAPFEATNSHEYELSPRRSLSTPKSVAFPTS